MLVHCRCGQEFTTYDPHFPHRVNCHMCGVKFMVKADGTTEEIRAISVRVNCRCGKPYTIHTLQFPRKVLCSDCNRRFSVLDTGEIIDAESDLDAEAMLESTAIQASAPCERKAQPITAIRSDPSSEPRHKQGLGDYKHAETVSPRLDRREESFARQLAAFDRRWQKQRSKHLVGIFDWFYFYPTRLMCLGLFIAFVPSSMLALAIFFAVFDIAPVAGWWVVLVSASISTGCFAHFFQRAALHDAAEKRWRAERDTLIHEHQLSCQQEMH